MRKRGQLSDRELVSTAIMGSGRPASMNVRRSRCRTSSCRPGSIHRCGSVIGKRALAFRAKRMILAADYANNVAGQPHKAQVRVHPVVGQRPDDDVELPQSQAADQSIGETRIDREAYVWVLLHHARDGDRVGAGSAKMDRRRSGHAPAFRRRCLTPRSGHRQLRLDQLDVAQEGAPGLVSSMPRPRR